MDGYVLAHSAFLHSVPYRSAIVFGKVQLVEGEEAKVAARKEFMENLFPGRWDELHPIDPQEMKATSIVFMDIDEATAKIPSGQVR